MTPGGGARVKESSVISEPRFILSEGLPPVPPKLQKRDFVDTAELLWELGRRQNLEAGRGGGAHISRREVHEACRCGGKGWQVYDSMFRQQAANNPKVNWSVLNSFLYSTSFLAMRGRACQHCMETDHASQACALAPTLVSKTGQGQGFSRKYGDQRRERTKIRGACFDWNEGKCDLPYCRFKHVCTKCGGYHQEHQCRGAAMKDPPFLGRPREVGRDFTS